MKYIYITAILFMWQKIYSQHPISGVVEYTIESIDPIKESGFAVDNNYDENKKKELIEIFTQPAYFIMKFTSNESLYKCKENSTMNSDSNKKPKLNFLQTFGGGSNGIYYSNSNEKNTLAQKSAFGELLLISYQFPNWELTSETKKIGDFVCYKAIKKQNNRKSKTLEEAWYTSEIPVQFGPNIYNGLPGLVLEVKVGKLRIIASKINLKDEKKIIIEKPDKGTRISEEDYIKKATKIADEFGF